MSYSHAAYPEGGVNAITGLLTLLGRLNLKGGAAAAIADLNVLFPHGDYLGTMGISLCLLGTMFLFGWSFTSFKIALIIAFLWMASPVSSHLISRLEVTTNEDLEKYCKMEKDEEEA